MAANESLKKLDDFFKDVHPSWFFIKNVCIKIIDTYKGEFNEKQYTLEISKTEADEIGSENPHVQDLFVDAMRESCGVKVDSLGIFFKKEKAQIIFDLH